MYRVLFGLGTVLGIAALFAFATVITLTTVTKYGNSRYENGKADAYAEVEHKAHEIEIKATALAAKMRERNDVENRAITANTADLRLRGPGKAVCPGTVAAAAASSGPVAASRPADATVGTLPDTERPAIIAMPFASTIAFAEQCDANRAELIARRGMEGTK